MTSRKITRCHFVLLLTLQNDELRQHSARAGELGEGLSTVRDGVAQISQAVSSLRRDTEQVVALNRRQPIARTLRDLASRVEGIGGDVDRMRERLLPAEAGEREADMKEMRGKMQQVQITF